MEVGRNLEMLRLMANKIGETTRQQTSSYNMINKHALFRVY